ncbi:MAG: lipopolysaccharide assembly protein LapA domain-containing protein [Brevinema sp.]
MKYIRIGFSLLIFLMCLIFAVQNIIPVDIRFFTINFTQIPLFFVIIIIFILGFILGRITAWFSYILSNKPKKK